MPYMEWDCGLSSSSKLANLRDNWTRCEREEMVWLLPHIAIPHLLLGEWSVPHYIISNTSISKPNSMKYEQSEYAISSQSYTDLASNPGYCLHNNCAWWTHECHCLPTMLASCVDSYSTQERPRKILTTLSYLLFHWHLHTCRNSPWQWSGMP